ncbi:hypothetical protein GCM10023168_13800 [Fodinibacter luteus]|uniref:Thiopeptide-type bacteriocin biosynthesis domain-containing protein n=1 Tax=Fodinibacter luteus TaxID=552064 RepID=A0ABP8KBE6_9MICO
MTWVQLNIGLSRADGPVLEQARRVFDAVVPQLDEARAQGDLGRFHFMRKPPDIRLRLEGPAPREHVLPKVEATLRRLREAGSVTAFAAGIYEPETRLFGGTRSMSLVHDYFDVDSRSWVDHDRLERLGATRLSADDLTARVVNDLFARTLDDRGEVWDTWCNVRQVVGDPVDEGQASGAQPVAGNSADAAGRDPDPVPAGVALGGLVEELDDGASAGEQELLRRYRTANTRLATGLRGLAHHGELECGLRVLLPFVAVFHFHRFGLDRRRQAVQAQAMAQAWDPRLGMRGGPSTGPGP